MAAYTIATFVGPVITPTIIKYAQRLSYATTAYIFFLVTCTRYISFATMRYRLLSDIIPQNAGWRWIYYVLLMWEFGQTIALLGVPETTKAVILRRKAAKYDYFDAFVTHGLFHIAGSDALLEIRTTMRLVKTKRKIFPESSGKDAKIFSVSIYTH